ncbi:MAG: polymerase subunit beta [Burkholderiales bacterium]|jgi:DNA polymerase-3 subunit beta|nr:polymerase subunit beta [Burkholderiales bacterium]MCE3269074.1 polymerase subunit beta [Burkholderiales bacterium]
MLLKLKRDILLKPLTLTTGFVEKKQTMPILSNVYLKKTGNQIVIIANDMEIQASITVIGDMSGEDFTITLPGKKLQDILKVFPDSADVIFEVQESRILVKSGKTKFVLQSMPADHYPLIRVNTELESEFTISQGIFKKLVGQIQYAMADKDSRVFLNGMLFEIKHNKLHLVATDAHRLGLVTTDLTGEVKDTSAIIPRKTIVELCRMLDENSTEALIIKFFDNQVYFETQNKQLITKVIDGKYPDYERVIPVTNDKLCLINRNDLLAAVERVGVIGIDKLKTLTFELNHDVLAISCHNEEQEESKDEIMVDYQGSEPLKLSFNISFVRDLLSNSHVENLQWAFYDNNRSVLVTIPNEINFKGVIMPLRI